MGDKIFDKDKLNRMSKIEISYERNNTEKEIKKQREMLDKFGVNDKYFKERKRHINLLQEKRSYIEKRLRELRNE